MRGTAPSTPAHSRHRTHPTSRLSIKIPISTLVLVYTPDLVVLLLERADFPEHWQSVTGSQEAGETLPQTAARELAEETGIDAARHGGVVDWRLCNIYEIYRQWRGRYSPGTTHNTEHVFGLLVPAPVEVRVAPAEHIRHVWLPWDAAAEKCFSWSNREAIAALPQRAMPRNRPGGDGWNSL